MRVRWRRDGLFATGRPGGTDGTLAEVPPVVNGGIIRASRSLIERSSGVVARASILTTGILIVALLKVVFFYFLRRNSSPKSDLVSADFDLDTTYYRNK